jgi:hypothetical protein
MFCWVLQTAETIVQGLNCLNLTPRHSSISKAHLVTAGAISMKLGVRILVPLAIRPELFFYFRDLTYFCGLQAAILKIRLLPFKSQHL